MLTAHNPQPVCLPQLWALLLIPPQAWLGPPTWPKRWASAYMLSCFSLVRLFVTLWTIYHQAPLSMGFSRQEYWSELPCPPSGDLPDPGIKPAPLMSPALAGGLFTTSTTWEASLRWAQADPVYPLTPILTGKLCILGKKIHLLQSIKKKKTCIIKMNTSLIKCLQSEPLCQLH